MTKTIETKDSKKLTWHGILWAVFLISLLFLVLLLGFYIAISYDSPWPFMFAVAGFSIAFAIHYFAVSIGLCGVYIQVSADEKFEQLRDIESRIVTSAMCVLFGGLTIIFAAGLSMIDNQHFIWVYGVGALVFFCSVCKYVLCERGWPREARKIKKQSVLKPDQALNLTN